MKEEWRKELQRKMADYEESDIDLSWEEIDKALAANRRKVLDADKRKAKVILLWSRRVAAAAVVLLLAGVGYWALQPQTQEAVETGDMPLVVSEATTSSEPLKKEQKAAIVLPKTATVSTNRLMALAESRTESGGLVHDSDSAMNQTTCPPDSATSSDKTTDKVTSKPQARPVVIYPSDLRKKTSSHNRLTAKVYVSNATTGYSSLLSSTRQIPITPGNQEPATNNYQPNGGNTDVTLNDETEDGITDSYPWGTSNTDDDDEDDTDQQGSNTRQGTSDQYRTQQTDETTHHHLPVRLGLSLRYRLNDHWSIESGLTYTRLSSDFTKTVDGKSTTTEQHLTYIGIPVNVSYLLWGSRYLNVYVSAGGMVEKMVKGSQQTSNMTTSVSIRPLQFSLNSAVGAEFNISRQFSLYAEPGLGYWFDNGSSISTYYQDKPLSFSLNFGIRVCPW